jgi:hypothetical protein
MNYFEVDSTQSRREMVRDPDAGVPKREVKCFFVLIQDVNGAHEQHYRIKSEMRSVGLKE